MSTKSRCEESCMAYRAQNNSCVEDELPCVPACRCRPGYYRNSEHVCVPGSQCACYPPGRNTSVPIGYTEVVSECYKWSVVMVGEEGGGGGCEGWREGEIVGRRERERGRDVCVPGSKCACYPPGRNTSVPIGYTEVVSECYKWSVVMGRLEE